MCFFLVSLSLYKDLCNVKRPWSCPLLVRVDTGLAAGLIPSMAPVQVFLYIGCLLLPLLRCWDCARRHTKPSCNVYAILEELVYLCTMTGLQVPYHAIRHGEGIHRKQNWRNIGPVGIRREIICGHHLQRHYLMGVIFLLPLQVIWRHFHLNQSMKWIQSSL